MHRKRTFLAAIAVACAVLAGIAMADDASTAVLAQARISRPDAAAAPLSSSEVRVEQHGEQILVHAQSDLDSDPTTIWSTLSDYDHLAQFIPDMRSSRSISRAGANVVVEQKGIARFGPIRQSFTVRFAVTEEPDESLSMSGVSGDFKLFDARYEILPLTPHRSRVVYDATIVPRFPVPAVFNVPAMRSMVRDQFGALTAEMLRRTSIRGQGES
jgi:ribosome-associated toxin RatA of RatAB toxin-antitoxin module